MVTCKYKPIPQTTPIGEQTPVSCLCATCTGCEDSETICNEDCQGRAEDVMIGCSVKEAMLHPEVDDDETKT